MLEYQIIKQVIKWLIIAGIIVSGIVCGFASFDLLTRSGVINEEDLNFKWEYKREQFTYAIAGRALEDKGNGHYELNWNIDMAYDYNGSLYEYILEFDGFLTKKVNQTATTFSSEQTLEFYDLNDKLLNSSTIKIYISFYPERTNFKITLDGTVADNASWYKFFKDYGITLNLIKVAEL